MLAIYKKELRQYFNSMIGFVFLAFFLVIIGIYTWAYNLSSGLGNFEVTLGGISFMYVLLVPILTMRIVAEENRQKTDQLLYTGIAYKDNRWQIFCGSDTVFMCIYSDMYISAYHSYVWN